MPYAPGIQDRSGELLAQGLDAGISAYLRSRKEDAAATSAAETAIGKYLKSDEGKMELVGAIGEKSYKKFESNKWNTADKLAVANTLSAYETDKFRQQQFAALEKHRAATEKHQEAMLGFSQNADSRAAEKFAMEKRGVEQTAGFMRDYHNGIPGMAAPEIVERFGGQPSGMGPHPAGAHQPDNAGYAATRNPYADPGVIERYMERGGPGAFEQRHLAGTNHDAVLQGGVFKGMVPRVDAASGGGDFHKIRDRITALNSYHRIIAQINDPKASAMMSDEDIASLRAQADGLKAMFNFAASELGSPAGPTGGGQAPQVPVLNWDNKKKAIY